jgi:hypothetical protein
MAFLQTVALLGSLAASTYAHGRVTSITADGESYDGSSTTTSTCPALLLSSLGALTTATTVLSMVSATLLATSSATARPKLARSLPRSPPAARLRYELIAADGKWSVTVPESLAPGQYVLRHEIIALHSAGDTNGAQNYPQCFNLEVTGSGTASPEGVLGTALYTPEDAGIKVGIYSPLGDSYEVPGPAVWSRASSGSPTLPPATLPLAPVPHPRLALPASPPLLSPPLLPPLRLSA